MSPCNIDPVNMFCWAHNTTIDNAELYEGCCALGWCPDCDGACNGDCDLECGPDEDYLEED